jgi:hypothetical protein
VKADDYDPLAPPLSPEEITEELHTIHARLDTLKEASTELFQAVKKLGEICNDLVHLSELNREMTTKVAEMVQLGSSR